MAIIDRKNAKLRKEITKEILSILGIPKYMYKKTVKDLQGEELNKFIKTYIKFIHRNFEECVGITLCGANGVGKTFASSLVLMHAYRSYYTVKLITFNEYISLVLNKVEPRRNYLLEDLKNREFLCIDELGKEPITSSGSGGSILVDLLKYREINGLPTIVCTNLNFKDISSRYGGTIYSLIVNGTLSITLEGKDNRQDIFYKKGVVQEMLKEIES